MPKPKRESSNLPSMPWFSQDYRRDTIWLSKMADLLYRRLLDLYWEQRGSVPFKPAKLAQLIDFSSSEWVEYWPEVEEYWETDSGKLKNRRADHELAFVQDKVEKRRKAAKIRWDKEKSKHSADASEYASASPHAGTQGHP